MPEHDVIVYARDHALAPTAQIDFYEELSWVDVFNGFGGWALTINAADPAVDYLRLQGSGITVKIDGQIAFSGFTTKIERVQEADVSKYVFSGLDDTGLLSYRLAHPQPGTASPPFSSTAYDNRTGICSTVLRAYVNANLGVGAVPERYDFRVSLGADLSIGSTVTGNGRYQQLDVLLNELATQSGNIGYRIRQNGSNLEFQTFEPNDRTDTVKFSTDIGSLSDFSYSAEAGSANFVYCGGQGTGTSRTISVGFDGTSIARWTRKEIFKDQRDTNDATTLQNSINEELANGSDIATVTFTPKDLPQQTYWTHYQTGDRVTVMVDGEPFEETLRQVECSLTPNEGLSIRPTVGTPNNTDTLKLYDRIAKQNKRLKNLERT